MPHKKHAFYIPVDPPLSRAEMAKLTEHQLLYRSLDDPKYAGFERHFDWHRYIKLVVSNPVFKAEITEVLDQWAHTGHGQHAIRQAYAVRQLKLKQRPDAEDAPFRNHKQVIIMDSNDCDNSVSNQASRETGIVYLNAHALNHNRFLAKNGHNLKSTLSDTMAHEIGHTRDPLKVLPVYEPVLNARIDKHHNELQIKRQNLYKALHLPYTDDWLKDIMYAESHLPQATADKLVEDIFRLKHNYEEKEGMIIEYPAILEANKYRRAQHLPERALVHDKGDFVEGPIGANENCPASPQTPTVPRIMQKTTSRKHR